MRFVLCVRFTRTIVAIFQFIFTIGYLFFSFYSFIYFLFTSENVSIVFFFFRREYIFILIPYSMTRLRITGSPGKPISTVRRIKRPLSVLLRSRRTTRDVDTTCVCCVAHNAMRLTVFVIFSHFPYHSRKRVVR